MERECFYEALAEPFTEEEERLCFERVARGDAEARKLAVVRNLRLVISITRAYTSRNSDDWDDCFQEGVVGLVKAVDKFDLKKGYRFGTYATFWIRNYVARYRSVNGIRSMSVPKHIGEMLIKLRQLATASQKDVANLSLDEVSECLSSTSLKTCSSVLLVLLADVYALELDAPGTTGTKGRPDQNLHEVLGGEMPDLDSRIDLHLQIQQAMNCLSLEERHYVVLRYFEEQPLQVVATALGCSIEGVMSLERRARKKLIRSLRRHVNC